MGYAISFWILSALIATWAVFLDYSFALAILAGFGAGAGTIIATVESK